jgi:hypothetical protein
VPPAVHLNAIIDAMEAQSDGSISYLDLDAGEVVIVSEELLREAEEHSDEEPDVPDWQRDEWGIAERIVSTERFIPLPTKFDVHEWEIMRDFAESVESGRIREDLLDAVHGAGGTPKFQEHRPSPRGRTGVVCLPSGCP